MLKWQFANLDELSSRQVMRLLSLRQAVFLIEQDCLYADIDSHDEDAMHMIGIDAQQNLVACLRVLAPGIAYPEPSIGRVALAQALRGQGLGRELILRGVSETHKLYPNMAIRISAQCYLLSLYESLGFETVGEPYLEDGIPHQEMLLEHQVV